MTPEKWQKHKKDSFVFQSIRLDSNRGTQNLIYLLSTQFQEQNAIEFTEQADLQGSGQGSFGLALHMLHCPLLRKTFYEPEKLLHPADSAENPCISGPVRTADLKTGQKF